MSSTSNPVEEDSNMAMGIAKDEKHIGSVDGIDGSTVKEGEIQEDEHGNYQRSITPRHVHVSI